MCKNPFWCLSHTGYRHYKVGPILHRVSNGHIWIYNVFTSNQMWCKCVCKYGICDINTVVHMNYSGSAPHFSDYFMQCNVKKIYDPRPETDLVIELSL